MSYSLNALYRAIGISKQAVASYKVRQGQFDRKVQALLIEAEDLREAHPGCGVEKMYYTLKPDFIGRDRFIDLFMNMGYRLKRKRNFRITTRSGDFYYPNKISGMEVNEPNQIWQSDITYISVEDRFYYAVFIIDVYTKEIVGYTVSDHMRATANLQALKAAISEHGVPRYHHSDRGSQYTYEEYVDLLKRNGTEISMGKIAQENAYAERINGTIKNEYIERWKPKSFGQLKSK